MGAVKAKGKTEKNTLLRKSRPPISSLYDTFNPRTYKGGGGGEDGCHYKRTTFNLISRPFLMFKIATKKDNSLYK